MHDKIFLWCPLLLFFLLPRMFTSCVQYFMDSRSIDLGLDSPEFSLKFLEDFMSRLFNSFFRRDWVFLVSRLRELFLVQGSSYGMEGVEGLYLLAFSQDLTKTPMLFPLFDELCIKGEVSNSKVFVD